MDIVRVGCPIAFANIYKAITLSDSMKRPLLQLMDTMQNPWYLNLRVLGLKVDEAIAAEVLKVVQPGAVEAAMQAQQQELQHRDEVRAALMRDLEAARIAADRAFRQCDATDPQNRLVAAELELRWNRALERVTQLQERIDAHDHQRPAPTSATANDFMSLANDLKNVWDDPATDTRLKKRIVRTLIHEVIADIEPQAG